MASRDEEKRIGDTEDTLDPAAAAVASTDQPLDIESKETEYLEITIQGSESEGLSEKEQAEEKQKDAKRAKLVQTKSYATTASAISEPQPAQKKKWTLNPLRWGRIPPVPEVRQISREYNAPFLSLVYFQWIAPLMAVSFHTHPKIKRLY